MFKTSRVRAALRKPFSVVAFRLLQEGRLSLRGALGYWPRLSTALAHEIASAAVRQPLHLGNLTLLSSKGLGALSADPDCAGMRKAIVAVATEINAGKYELFGANIPAVNHAHDWWSDWRFGKTWQPQYFRKYHFYESRTIPYDVKFPWELSRLQFLPPLLLAAGVSGKGGEQFIAATLKTLSSWRASNPVAQTVVWYPMEASIRIFTLTYLFDLAKMLEPQHASAGELLPMLAAMLAEHGEFVWSTREYSDVRGNHYAANVSALLVVGAALHEALPGARRWYRFGLLECDREVQEQFSSDGVNIEKSIPYHRLVTELFLAAAMTARSRGDKFSEAASMKLKAACAFLKSVRRADGLSPNWGDNDDGRVFTLEMLPVRNHDGLLQTAAALFSAPELVPPGTGGLLNALVHTGARPPATQASSDVLWFVEGGFVVAQQPQQYLLVDTGSVGLHGRGGHGHLDLLSFEYCLYETPIIVDPGCPTYTGDFVKRNAFRSGRSHNILLVDGQDIGRLVGTWEIADPPVPQNIRVDDSGGPIIISGSHSGYDHASVSRYERRFALERSAHRLVCSDELDLAKECTVERRFFLAYGARMIRSGGAFCEVEFNGRFVRMSWDTAAHCEISECQLSPGYGQEQTSIRLTLQNRASGNVALQFEVLEIGQKP